MLFHLLRGMINYKRVISGPQLCRSKPVKGSFTSDYGGPKSLLESVEKI